MNNKSIQTCVTSSAFLSEAVKLLVYKTPQKIIDYVEKHKHDCLIKNPPYEVRN